MRRSASSLLISSKPMDFSASKTTKFSSGSASSSSSLAAPLLLSSSHRSTAQLPLRTSNYCKPLAGASGKCFFTVFLFLVCFSLYLFSFSRGYQFSSNFDNAGTTRNRGYAIIIDAGSSGSRVHVFQYIDNGPLPIVTIGREDLSLKTKPGLSSFAEDPHNAGYSLMDLLKFASSKVPERERETARIYLMATAGLRRLDFGTQERILESCRIVLRVSGFRFRDEWASVVSGTEEGVFAWVAANYAMGSLGKTPEDTVGIIELGGASVQVTFIPSTLPPPEFLHTVDVGGVTYPLYTHSFLHFGQEAAWDGVMQLLLSRISQENIHSYNRVVDPCTPKGYMMNSEELAKILTSMKDVDPTVAQAIDAAGNFSECKNMAMQLLQKGQDKCVYQKCAIGSTFVPRLSGKFFATENFFYTSQFFGLVTKATLADFQNAGVQYCEDNWRTLQQKHEGVSKEDLLKYCFSSAYIVAFLHDSLGVPMDDESVVFTNKIGAIPLDWPLGAFIVKLREDSFSERTADMVEDYKTIFSFILVSLAVGLLVLIFYWWRRPTTKTIYDLEKGRYITTITRNLNKF